MAPIARDTEALAASGAEWEGQSAVIAADGSERPVLDEMAGRPGLPNVHFEGPIYDQRELARYFLLCDVFVTLDVASLAEAMMVGIPCVAESRRRDSENGAQ